MLQYNLYKGTNSKWGAIQLQLKPATIVDDLKQCRDGVIFVNACSAVGPNKYDWDNKFMFGLGLVDIGKIIHFFVSAGEGDSLSLVHDPNKGKDNEGSVIKSMGFYTKSGCLNGCMITCSTKQGKDTVSHKIPVSGDEVITLKCLLEQAIPLILGWR